MISKRKLRHTLKMIYVLCVIVVGIWQLYKTNALPQNTPATIPAGSSAAAQTLNALPVKGRATKTGYSRKLFSDGWGNTPLCDIRNAILARDMTHVTYVPATCKVASGILLDPYTNSAIPFQRGGSTSDVVQIDHVVALGDAWQKGAQQLSVAERYALANDPLNLLAVDGKTNQNKGDSDAASWLPPNKAYRCAYVARQIAVKWKYHLWITPPERQSMAGVLINCPDQTLPQAQLLRNHLYSLVRRPEWL